MRIIDVHAHYEDEKYDDDRDQVINRQFENGVEYIINAGAGIESSKGAIEVAKKYDNIYCTIGVHPEFVDKGENVDNLRKLYEENNNEKIVAIGEIGLDYHYTKENKEKQKKLFKDQLEFAYEVGLPVQIHSRDASIDTIEVLENTKKKPNKIMFHCFDLNFETAKYIIKKGYSVSLGGNITYKRKSLAYEVLREIPIESIMTETDSPYLSPESKRGERNESKNIADVINKIAEIRDMSVEEVINKTYENAVKFYGLG